MKKLVFLLFIIIGVQLSAQDYIMLLNGDEIKSKVLEINNDNIKYKKYSNLNGPTYTINKSEIFLIKYQSGDKDIFNAKTGSGNTSYNSGDSPREFIFDPTIGTVNCQVQRSPGVKIYGNKSGDVFFREDIVFYGYDLTYVRLTNPDKVGRDMMLIQDYFNDWYKVMNDKVGISQLKKWMDKPYMLVGTPVYQNYYKRDFNKFVEYGNFCISFDDLQKIVNSYVLNETQGIGMVINLVNFNKEREYSMQWVTFFDISTREIIFAVLTTGRAAGAGMVGHWAVGVEMGVRDMFIDEVYKKRASNNGMIPSKLRLY